MTDIKSEHMYMFSFLVRKTACLNYREFNPEDDLVGVQSFITLSKLG